MGLRTVAVADGVNRTTRLPDAATPVNSLTSDRRGPPASFATSKSFRTTVPCSDTLKTRWPALTLSGSAKTSRTVKLRDLPPSSPRPMETSLIPVMPEAATQL